MTEISTEFYKELLDRMTMRVVLDGDVPEDCVKEAAENVSRMPEVLIRGCYFDRTPTRGVLLPPPPAERPRDPSRCRCSPEARRKPHHR